MQISIEFRVRTVRFERGATSSSRSFRGGVVSIPAEIPPFPEPTRIEKWKCSGRLVGRGSVSELAVHRGKNIFRTQACDLSDYTTAANDYPKKRSPDGVGERKKRIRGWPRNPADFGLPSFSGVPSSFRSRCSTLRDPLSLRRHGGPMGNRSKRGCPKQVPEDHRAFRRVAASNDRDKSSSLRGRRSQCQIFR